MSQPVTGFQVASVHSIALLSAKVVTLDRPSCSPAAATEAPKDAEQRLGYPIHPTAYLGAARYRLKPWQFGVGVLNQLREHLERSHSDRLPLLDRPVHG